MEEEREGRSLRMMKTKMFASEPNTVKNIWERTSIAVRVLSPSITLNLLVTTEQLCQLQYFLTILSYHSGRGLTILNLPSNPVCVQVASTVCTVYLKSYLTFVVHNSDRSHTFRYFMTIFHNNTANYKFIDRIKNYVMLIDVIFAKLLI